MVLPTGDMMPMVSNMGGEGHYAVAAVANGKAIGIKHFDVRYGCGRC